MVIFKNRLTIHTSRTMMFSELSKLMDHAMGEDNYSDFLNINIANKTTRSNQDKTSKYLQQLYILDASYLPFKAFKYFWQVVSEIEKPIIALLYAISHDYLLAESVDVIINTAIGEKVTIEKLEENIEQLHPGRYSVNTRKSLAQNIASSWKQAGFITGKVKNTRTEPKISYYSVVFAFLMAYMNGERGDFILNSKWVNALGMKAAAVRHHALEGAKRDLLQYQYAGNVTTVSFNNLLAKMNIDGIQS